MHACLAVKRNAGIVGTDAKHKAAARGHKDIALPGFFRWARGNKVVFPTWLGAEKMGQATMRGDEKGWEPRGRPAHIDSGIGGDYPITAAQRIDNATYTLQLEIPRRCIVLMVCASLMLDRRELRLYMVKRDIDMSLILPMRKTQQVETPRQQRRMLRWPRSARALHRTYRSSRITGGVAYTEFLPV